jgi:hypothetical protein
MVAKTVLTITPATVTKTVTETLPRVKVYTTTTRTITTTSYTEPMVCCPTVITTTETV